MHSYLASGFIREGAVSVLQGQNMCILDVLLVTLTGSTLCMDTS